MGITEKGAADSFRRITVNRLRHEKGGGRWTILSVANPPPPRPAVKARVCLFVPAERRFTRIVPTVLARNPVKPRWPWHGA